MNKKLFSWKALAGLALLVAVGLTSCKQGTEVDPENPTSKPVKPGTSTAGDADLTFTITNASGGDLTTLWNTWKKNNADAAKALMAEDEITIALDFTNFKLDGKTITLPQFVTTPDGSIINILVSGFAEAKKVFDLDAATNLQGAEINITLPAAEFDMKLNAVGALVTLDGDATLNTLDATAGGKKLALSIEDNVVVEGITMAGALASTDNVEAIILDADPAIEKGKGFQVGSEKVYVKSAILTEDITIAGADETALETIYIVEGKTLTLGSKKSEIEAIIGLGDMSDATKSNTIQFAGDEDDFSKIGAISNAHLKNGNTYTNVEDMSIFDNVVFDMNVNLIDDGAADTEFNANVVVIVAEDADEISFSNVNFGKKAEMYFDGSVDITTSKNLVKMFQYSKADDAYKAVKDDDEDNLTAANKKGEEADFSYVAGKYGWWDDDFDDIEGEGITLTDKFHFAKIEEPQDALDKAYEAYVKAATDGGEGYSDTNTKYAAYATAWKAVYGINTVKTAGTATTPVVFNKAENNTNLYVKYKMQWAFVTDANAAIDGSSWFTLYTYTEDTLEPELVSLAFDADCTIGGKAIDADKLNTMCNWPWFSSVADAWLIVSYGDTVYKWKKTTGAAGYVLK